MENVNIQSMIRERFAKLPPKLQKAITSTDVTTKLRGISQKYRLHIDQGQIFENETYMVLLGIEQAEKYEENLKKELEISDEEAQNLAQDVTNEIFLSVRNLLKESTTPKIEPNKQTTTTNTSNQSFGSGFTQETSNIQTTENSQSKLESIVKNKQKGMKVTHAKHYSIDPYREPIE